MNNPNKTTFYAKNLIVTEHYLFLYSMGFWGFGVLGF